MSRAADNWIEIRDLGDAERLLSLTGNFHDDLLREFRMATIRLTDQRGTLSLTPGNNLWLLLQGQGNPTIELCFLLVSRFEFQDQEWIDCASLVLSDGQIAWSGIENWTAAASGCTVAVGRRAFWRRLDWNRRRLLYEPGEYPGGEDHFPGDGPWN